MTWWIGDSPRPPQSLGHESAAKPASAFFRWNAFACFRPSSPYRLCHVSNVPRFGSALAARNARASARNAASSLVSVKSIRDLAFRCRRSGGDGGCRRVGARLDPGNETVLPARHAAEHEPEELRAAVV